MVTKRQDLLWPSLSDLTVSNFFLWLVKINIKFGVYTTSSYSSSTWPGYHYIPLTTSFLLYLATYIQYHYNTIRLLFPLTPLLL